MIKQFSDLKFNPLYDGVQALIKFGDEYELYVVSHGSSYGGAKGLYEIAVFKNSEQTEMVGVTHEGDTVKGFLTEEDVTCIIKKMIAVTGFAGD